MSSTYAKGRNFEYRVRKMLMSEGYEVQRSILSRGPYDLIADNRITIRLIQCKKTKDGYMTHDERKYLIEARDNKRLECRCTRVTAEVAFIGTDKSDKRKTPVRFKIIDDNWRIEDAMNNLKNEDAA